jgi:hypothetical protein
MQNFIFENLKYIVISIFSFSFLKKFIKKKKKKYKISK